MPVSGQLNKKQIHINDTFDINYFNEDFQPSLGESTLAEPNNRQPPINTVGEPINRFEAPRARSTMFPIPNIGEGGRMPQQSTNYGTTWHENQRRINAGKIVRSWKVKFSGQPDNIEEFIQRIQECRMSADLSEEDILNSLTELMTGKALHWCRSQRRHWRNWNDFCASARQWFGVEREFQQRLEAEAIARTQRLNEPVTDYIICLRAILDKMIIGWDEVKKIRLLY